MVEVEASKVEGGEWRAIISYFLLDFRGEL